MIDEMSCWGSAAPGVKYDSTENEFAGGEAGRQITLPTPSDRAANLVSRVVLLALPGRLGLTLQFIAMRTGAVICAIHPTCTFRNLVSEGDCIVSIDGRAVICARDLRVGEDRTRVLSIIRHSAAARAHAWYPAANGTVSCVSDGATAYRSRESIPKTVVNQYRSDKALAYCPVQMPNLSDCGSSSYPRSSLKRIFPDKLGMFDPYSSKSDIGNETHSLQSYLGGFKEAHCNVKMRRDCKGIHTSERDQKKGCESHKENYANMDSLRKPIKTESRSVNESLKCEETDDESKREWPSEPIKIESQSFCVKREETGESSEEEEVSTCAKQCWHKDQKEGEFESHKEKYANMASFRKPIKIESKSVNESLKCDEIHKKSVIKRESQSFHVKQEETAESSEEEGVPTCAKQCQHKDKKKGGFESHNEKNVTIASLRKLMTESRRVCESLNCDETDESKIKCPRGPIKREIQSFHVKQEETGESSEEEGVPTCAKQCQHEEILNMHKSEEQIQGISPLVTAPQGRPNKTPTLDYEAGGNARMESQPEQEGQSLYHPNNTKYTIPRNAVSAKRRAFSPFSSAHLVKEEGGIFEGIASNEDDLSDNGNAIGVSVGMKEAIDRLRNKKNEQNLSVLAEEDATSLKQIVKLAPASFGSTLCKKLEMTKWFMQRGETKILAKKDMAQIFPNSDLFSMLKCWAQNQPNAILNNIALGRCIIRTISSGINAYGLKQSDLERVLMILFMHKSKPHSMKIMPKGDIEQPPFPILQKRAAHLIAAESSKVNLAVNFASTIEESVNAAATTNNCTASTSIAGLSPDSIGLSNNEQVSLSFLHTELFLPSKCHLNFKSMDGSNGRQIVVTKSQLGLSRLKNLFAKASLKVPNEHTMKKLGSVSTSTSSGMLVSCLLFQKDESSEAIQIFDIVRLVTEPDWQRKGFATKSMNTFMILLRRNFPRSKIVIRADVLKRKQVKSFYTKAGFTKGVPSGLSTGYNCGRPDCDTYHFEVKQLPKKKSLLAHVSMHQPLVEGSSGSLPSLVRFHHSEHLDPDTMPQPNLKPGHLSQLQPSQPQSYSQSLSRRAQTLSQNPNPLPFSKSCPQSKQPDAQIQSYRPCIEVYCSPHSRLKFKGTDLCNQYISQAEFFDSIGIKALLRRARLLPLNNDMHKIGSVSLRARPDSLRSCLIYKRDDESSALSAQIFDIARFTVGKDCQSFADARHCLNVFRTLLRQNFPRDKILLRAAVLNRFKKFYESVGFTKGVPWGLSKGPWCGHTDCATFHLLVQEPPIQRAVKKRARPTISTKGKEAGAVGLARGSACIKRIREQADFLNSEDQMVPNYGKAEMRGSSELFLEERAPVAANATSKKSSRKKLKSSNSYNDFQFTGLSSEFCRCVSACSANCPVKPRIDGKIGMARAFTTHGKPIGHTKEFRQRKIEVMSRESIQPVNQRAKGMTSVFLKRQHVLQGSVTKCNYGGASSDDNGPGQIQQKLDKTVSMSATADSKAADMEFRKGQHVWACMGKGRHPALILSIQDDVNSKSSEIATVKWTTSNTRSKVKLSQLLPMFEEEDSDSMPIKRRRLERAVATTDRFSQTNCFKGDDVKLPNSKNNSSRRTDYRKQKCRTGTANCPELIAGSRALVLCKGKLFKATILKQSSKNLHRVLIHYDGHRKTNTSWITDEMISMMLGD